MEKALKKLDTFISRYKKFIVTTHESPDADGLGAEIAFKMLLEELGKTVLILNGDPVPENVRFIDIDNEIGTVTKTSKLPDDVEEFAQFVLDTNDYDNTGNVYDLFKDKIQECFIIDHHESKGDKVESNFIKAEASSVSEIIYELYRHYDKEITFKAAQAIYTGMVFDTGSFKYPKTTSLTFEIASHCLELGVQPYYIYQQLYEQNTVAGFELRGRILSTMEIFHGGQMIAMKLTKEMLEETGASFPEGETAINFPLTVKGVVISLLIKETIEGQVKVSMRSKGNYNVAQIAMKNGGGGHKNAAGFKSKLPVEKTYSKIVTNITNTFFTTIKQTDQ